MSRGPRTGETFRIKKRQIEFRLGTAGRRRDRARGGAIEFAITAGAGGQGTVWIDDLELVRVAGG